MPTGDTWSLTATAIALGHDAEVVDHNYKQATAAEPAWDTFDAIVVHLWGTDKYGEPLRRLAPRLNDLCRAAPVIAHGYLAAAAAPDLTGFVDRILHTPGPATAHVPVTLASTPGPQHHAEPDRAVEEVIRTWASTPAPLSTLDDQHFEALDDTTVFSIASSRGCRARCSFCAYNSDITGWTPLLIQRANTGS